MINPGIDHPWYDQNFIHPQAEILHELQARRQPPDYYWSIAEERAYSQALLGEEYYDRNPHTQICALLRATDAFRFNAILYDMFVVSTTPPAVAPVLCACAVTFQEMRCQGEAAKQGEDWDWPAVRYAYDKQREIEHAAYEAVSAAWRQYHAQQGQR